MPVKPQRESESDKNKLPETLETEPGGESSPTDRSPTDEAREDGRAEGETAADVASLEAEIADLKDRMLRAYAEAENVRQRAEREKADARKYGIALFARDLVNVADNFQRAMASVNDTVREDGGEAFANLVAGIAMIERELKAAFERNGIREITPSPGDRFDPNLHQAVAEVPGGIVRPGHIVEVTQVGYTLEDRLLRPAMVLVAGEAPGDAGPPA